MQKTKKTLYIQAGNIISKLLTIFTDTRAVEHARNIASSSPKTALKTAPTLHPDFSVMNKINRYFTKYTTSICATGTTNKHYFTHSYRAPGRYENIRPSSPENDLKAAPGKGSDRSRHFATKFCAANEVEKSPEDLQSAASKNCLATYQPINFSTNQQNIASSSPKTTLKTTPTLHSVFSLIKKINRYFTKYITSICATITTNKYYFTHKYRALERYENIRPSSPKNDPKAATGKVFKFLITIKNIHLMIQTDARDVSTNQHINQLTKIHAILPKNSPQNRDRQCSSFFN